MSEVTVKPEEFAATVKKILEEAEAEDVEKFNTATDEKAKAAVRELRAASKIAFGKGSYQKGWTKKKKKLKTGYYKYIVWNKTNYRLTHLLENGHVKVLWGDPAEGRVAGREHIRPVAEKTETEWMNAVTEALSK